MSDVGKPLAAIPPISSTVLLVPYLFAMQTLPLPGVWAEHGGRVGNQPGPPSRARNFSSQTDDDVVRPVTARRCLHDHHQRKVAERSRRQGIAAAL